MKDSFDVKSHNLGAQFMSSLQEIDEPGNLTHSISRFQRIM